MKNKLVVLASMVAASGCATGDFPRSGYVDMASVDQDQIAPYHQVVDSFFSAALAADVNAMLDLTSGQTWMQKGVRKLPAHYEKDTIPALRACGGLLPGGKVRGATFEETKTGPGYIFIKHCSNPKYADVGLVFVVLKEGGHFVLAEVAAE